MDDLDPSKRAGSSVYGPSLEGRWAYLRPITEADYAFLFALSTDETTGFRWRFRGETPSPEGFAHAIWHDVLAQFLVCSVATNEPAGHVLAFNPNLRDRHADIAMVVRPDRVGHGWALEGAQLFIDYLFATWDFRKLYAWVAEFNLTRFSSVIDRRMFTVEGRLGEHEYYGDRYWDVVVLGLHRRRWEEFMEAVRTRRVARRQRAMDLRASLDSRRPGSEAESSVEESLPDRSGRGRGSRPSDRS
jgi:RimJ/RimL family protein N-acetyltransferase